MGYEILPLSRWHSFVPQNTIIFSHLSVFAFSALPPYTNFLF